MKTLCSIIFAVVCILQPAWAQGPRVMEFDNALLKISFNKSTMTWSMYQRNANDWNAVLQSASVDLLVSGPDSMELRPLGNEVTGKTDKYSDAIGIGKQMTVQITTKRALWLLSFVLYDGKSIGTLQLSIKNTSTATWETKELRLIELRDAAFLQFPTDNILMHVNGYQSWSQTDVVRLDSLKRPTSYWSALFYEPEAYRSLLFGFITNRVSTNRFSILPINVREGQIQMTTQSSLVSLELKPENELRSDRLLFSFDSSPNNNLSHYGEYLQTFAPQINKPFTPTGKQNVAALDKIEVPTGWCSWYYYYDRISEDSIIQNLNFAAKHLKSAGLNYIQIDDGYQIAAGDWETNKKFPNGHRWLVDRIHEKKLLAGLWVAPFAVAENSTVFKEHPDWLLRDERDSLKLFSTNETWGGKIYSLDPSIHEVQMWLENLFYKIESYWGYDYVKIDFLYYANEGGKYRIPMTSTQAYQLGLAAIRRGVGSDKFILACGAPLGSSVGYVDGMRIGNDIFAGWNGITPGAKAAARRFYLHGKVWYNDPDCLVVRDPLTLDQARVWASVVALSGQMNLLSDKLTALPQQRVDVLKMTIPAYGKPATPLDGFTAPRDEGLSIISTADDNTIRLPAVWKFSTGDDPAWKNVQFDDSHWNDIPVPAQWEEAGYPNYDGFVWYRAKFTLPDNWKHAPVMLSLGKIDDCDQTYVNGTLVGQTGTMPPEYNTEWTAFRTYKIPDNLVNRNGENTIAVRVYDGGGPGGIYSISPVHLPSVWNLPIEKNFENWNVVGIFNWSEHKTRITLTPAQLELPVKKSYLVYEAWSSTFLGELRNSLSLDLRPTASMLLSIHEKKRYPVVLSTSRHITQGAVDLAGEQWDEGKRSLSIISDHLIDGEYDVIIYMPEGYSSPNISAPCKSEIEKISDSIVKVKLFPYSRPKVAWKALFQ